MGRTKKDAWDVTKGALGSLFALAIIALPGILAWIKQMPWFLIPLSVVFMAGNVLWTMNQWKQWRRGRGISRLSDKKIEQIIREWIDIPEVSIERKPPQPDVYFNFTMKYKTLNINIIRHKESPAIVQLVARIQTSLLDIPFNEEALRKNAGKVGIEMARLGIDYRFDGSPNPRDFILLIDPVILDDSLTEFYFRKRIMFVFRASVLVLETAKQTADELGLRPV